MLNFLLQIQVQESCLKDDCRNNFSCPIDDCSFHTFRKSGILSHLGFTHELFKNTDLENLITGINVKKLFEKEKKRELVRLTIWPVSRGRGKGSCPKCKLERGANMKICAPLKWKMSPPESLVQFLSISGQGSKWNLLLPHSPLAAALPPHSSPLEPGNICHPLKNKTSFKIAVRTGV